MGWNPKGWFKAAAPWAAAYLSGQMVTKAIQPIASGLGGLGGSLTGGGGSGVNPAALAGGAAAIMSAAKAQGLVAEPVDGTTPADAAAQLTAEQQDQARAQQEATQIAEDKARQRAKLLTNGRQGSIKTSPLGLPGGGFAQKSLLGG